MVARKRANFILRASCNVGCLGIYTCYTHQQVTETQNANTIATSSFYTANRSYIMWNDFLVRDVMLPAGIHKWQVNAQWQNFGNVPARYVVTNCKENVEYTSVPPALTCTPVSNPPPSGVIGPKQILPFAGPMIERKDMADTLGAKAYVYVFGYITYHDNLRDTEHQTRFCDAISQAGMFGDTIPQTPNSSSLPVPINAFGYAGCNDPKWNCFDDGCPPL